MTLNSKPKMLVRMTTPVFSFLFFLISSHAFASVNSDASGAWQTIGDTHDPDVQRLAKFAVSEFSKHEGGGFELARVVSAEHHVSATYKYRLLLDVKTPTGDVSQYGALVDEPTKGDIILVAFDLIQASVSTRQSSSIKTGGGSWETITNLHDPEVLKIATFAVSEYGKQQGARFELVDVVAARRKAGAGLKYQLALHAKDSANSVSKYGALVDQSFKGDLKLVAFAQVKPAVN